MPYIAQKRRGELAQVPNYNTPETAGELNYMLSLLVIQYMNQHGLSYKIINDIVGALESAKQEFYRRVAVPYEDLKRKENGDVYPEIT